jgi:hypothetical protein
VPPQRVLVCRRRGETVTQHLKGFSQLIPLAWLGFLLELDFFLPYCLFTIYSLDTHTVVGRGQCEYSLTATRPGMAEQDPSIWEDVSALSPPRPTQPNP